MVLLKQMIVLFLIMIVGLLCRKAGIINDETSKKLSAIVVNVANPAMILSSAINPGDTIKGHDLLITFILAIVMFAGLMFLAIFIPYLLKAPRSDFGIYRAMTVFANIGFMGFPLIRSVYGPDALLYAAVFQLPFNLLVYTYGVYVICESRNLNDSKEIKRNPIKEIMNIGVVSCIIAIILFFVRPTVPSVIEDVCDYIGDMTPPLSMMIIGDSLSKIDIKKLISNARLLAYSLIKLLVLPITGTLIAKECGIDGVLLGVFMIIMAGPAATMNALLSQQYDSNYQLASEGVALSTILSVATIPLVSLILGL